MSGCFSFLFFLVIFLMVASGMGVRLPLIADRGPWRRLAREFNGHFTTPSLFSAPALRFNYGGHQVTLKATRREIQFTINWFVPDLASSIVFPKGHRPLKLRHPIVEMDDGEFDKKYRVHSSNVQATRSLLSTGVLEALDRLVSMQIRSPLHVSFRPGRLMIIKRAHFNSHARLQFFLRTCLQLFDQAMLTRAEGIDFCEEQNDDFLPIQDVMCQVCGELIADGELVSCSRCHTPHHQECWEYYGSCTVFGCQECDYEHPKMAPLIRYIRPGEPPGGDNEETEGEDTENGTRQGEGVVAGGETLGHASDASVGNDAIDDGESIAKVNANHDLNASPTNSLIRPQGPLLPDESNPVVERELERD